MHSAIVDTGRYFSHRTNWISGTLASGQTKIFHNSEALRAKGKIPVTERISHDSPASPTKMQSVTAIPDESVHWQNSTEMAMGRSKYGQRFLVSAGARFTVIRLGRIGKPELRKALRKRSRLSNTAASHKPTMDRDGSPDTISDSTESIRTSRPSSTKENTLEYMEIFTINPQMLRTAR